LSLHEIRCAGLQEKTAFSTSYAPLEFVSANADAGQTYE
jgi:hypothetical protein